MILGGVQDAHAADMFLAKQDPDNGGCRVLDNLTEERPSTCLGKNLMLRSIYLEGVMFSKVRIAVMISWLPHSSAGVNRATTHLQHCLEFHVNAP